MELSDDSTGTRSVYGYEGLYKVTEDGRVIGCKSNKVLRPENQNGYARVKLYKDAKGKCFFVHRIVARSFCDGYKPGLQVNHKDGNKLNNKASNLEWVTQKDNNKHAIRNGLNSTQKAVQSNKKRVVQYSMDGSVLAVWDSLSDAGRFLQIPVSNISNCCHGRIKNAGGYK